MGDVSHLVYAILKFLEEQQMHSTLDQDAVESLEVASQCLESAFHISPQDPANSARYPMPASLPEIFAAGLAQKVAGRFSGLDIGAPYQTPAQPCSATETCEMATPLQSEARPEASLEEKADAERLKSEGNEFMKQGSFKEALGCYTKAIERDGNNAVYYCNRAAAFSKMNEHEKAIEDCITACQIDPSYSKAYGRKGLAHTALSEHRLAKECYERALSLEPDNESYRNNLELSEQKLREDAMGSGFGAGMGGPGGLNMGGMDFSQMLNNPALMNMATNMLSNPQMQQMMSNLMSGAGGGGGPGAGGPGAGAPLGGGPGVGDGVSGGPPGGLGNLLQVGQQLAQQMQQSNPELVEQLRQQMNAPGPNQNPPGGQDGTPPPGVS